jgi:hypothetical protein
LNAYLEGIVDVSTYLSRQHALQDEQRLIEGRLQTIAKSIVDLSSRALELYDFAQNAAEMYHSSNSEGRRGVLVRVSMNRTLDVGKLCLVKRKPFDFLVEGLSTSFGPGDRIRTCDLLVPNQTL